MPASESAILKRGAGAATSETQATEGRGADPTEVVSESPSGLDHGLHAGRLGERAHGGKCSRFTVVAAQLIRSMPELLLKAKVGSIPQRRVSRLTPPFNTATCLYSIFSPFSPDRIQVGDLSASDLALMTPQSGKDDPPTGGGLPVLNLCLRIGDCERGPG